MSLPRRAGPSARPLPSAASSAAEAEVLQASRGGSKWPKFSASGRKFRPTLKRAKSTKPTHFGSKWIKMTNLILLLKSALFRADFNPDRSLATGRVWRPDPLRSVPPQETLTWTSQNLALGHFGPIRAQNDLMRGSGLPGPKPGPALTQTQRPSLVRSPNLLFKAATDLQITVAGAPICPKPPVQNRLPNG